MAELITLAPQDRYALVGKSRSGKTSQATVLVCKIVPYERQRANGWEAWWVDTKNDKRDIDRLHRWGFTDGYSGKSPRKLISIPFEKGKPMETVKKVDEICYRALEQHGVVLVIDEYRHCVPTTRTASPGMLHVHQRGAGRDVGMIGLTQEPCEIPRQLISQAGHIFLFNVSYPYDIKYCKTINDGYKRPKLKGHQYGFYYAHVDGDNEWRYYKNQQEWTNSFELTPTA